MAGGWNSLGLMEELVRVVEEDEGWKLPTAIQDESIPLILGGGDVMATAETGSGKTAAFVLPAIQLCVEKKQRVDETHTNDENDTLHYHDCHDSLQVATYKSGIYELRSKDKKNGWIGWRSPIGFSQKSKFYWECTNKEGGIVRVGLSTLTGTIHMLGTDEYGWGYGSTGWKVHNNQYTEYGVVIQPNDVIGCYYNGSDICFSCNGTSLGSAFILNENKNKNKKIVYYPTICMKQKASCQVQLVPPFQNYSTFQSDSTSRSKQCQSFVDKTFQNPNCQAKGPHVIILEPTKDLARQTHDTIQTLSRYIHPPIKTQLFVGGGHSTSTKSNNSNNNIDIVVGTPQVVAMQQKKHNWNACQLFILDEADGLIENQEFLKHIYSLYTKLIQNQSKFLKQKHSTRKNTKSMRNSKDVDRFQVCFFSATLRTDQVQEVTSQICQNPLWVDVNNDEGMDGIHHKINECVVHVFVKINKHPSTYIPLDDDDGDDDLPTTDAVHRGGILKNKTILSKLSKPELESECIKLLKPQMAAYLIEMLEMEQVLIFCRTNLDCELLEKYFQRKSSSTRSSNNDNFLGKWSCCVVAGKKRSTEDRRKNLRKFQNGEVRILIATDAASRGIDIKELPFVINMTLPDVPQTYIHRVGRLGRAQKRMGFALSFIPDHTNNRGKRFQEKVWYCQPSNTPPCINTDLYEEGGNCIWYDECSIYERINKDILKKQENCHVEEMEWPSCEISPTFKSMIQSKGYYTPKQEKESSAILRQMIPIQEKVKQLQSLQTNLENDFWNLTRLE